MLSYLLFLLIPVRVHMNIYIYIRHRALVARSGVPNVYESPPEDRVD